jgi:TPR repeat protein
MKLASRWMRAFVWMGMVALLCAVGCRKNNNQRPLNETNELKAKAESGDASAMYSLAEKYHYGYDVPKDLAAAVEWYNKSAEKGNGSSMVTLGIMYRTGDGVPRDYVKARQWLEKAYAAHESLALYHIGEMYRQGEGMPASADEAANWYRKAIKEGGATSSVTQLSRDRLMEMRMGP